MHNAPLHNTVISQVLIVLIIEVIHQNNEYNQPLWRHGTIVTQCNIVTLLFNKMYCVQHGYLPEHSEYNSFLGTHCNISDLTSWYMFH